MEITIETQTEQLAEGLTRHYLMDRQIMVFTFENIHQRTMDIWANSVRDALNHCPADRPYLTIFNYLPVKNISFTPYARKKASELTPLASQVKGRTALVLPRSLVSQIVALFLRTQRNQIRQRRVFHNLDDAVKWCSELLP